MDPSPLSGSPCEQCHDAPVMECLIALTQDWTVRVGPWWYPLLRGYRWQAYVRVQGRLSMIGELPTEYEAPQARGQRVLALGLSPLVRLNFPGEQERSHAHR